MKILKQYSGEALKEIYQNFCNDEIDLLTLMQVINNCNSGITVREIKRAFCFNTGHIKKLNNETEEILIQWIIDTTDRICYEAYLEQKFKNKISAANKIKINKILVHEFFDQNAIVPVMRRFPGLCEQEAIKNLNNMFNAPDINVIFFTLNRCKHIITMTKNDRVKNAVKQSWFRFLEMYQEALKTFPLSQSFLNILNSFQELLNNEEPELNRLIIKHNISIHIEKFFSQISGTSINLSEIIDMMIQKQTNKILSISPQLKDELDAFEMAKILTKK